MSLTISALTNPELASAILQHVTETGENPTSKWLEENSTTSAKNMARNLDRLEQAGHLDRSTTPWTVPAHTQRILKAMSGASDMPAAEAGIQAIPVAQIRENPNNPRKTFDPDKLEELRASLAEHGQEQNIGVRQTGADQFEVIYGSRRHRAACLNISLKVWPESATLLARIYPAGMSDADVLEMALAENMQRHDVDPFEQSQSFYQLYQMRAAEFGSPQDAAKYLAKKFGRGERTIQFDVQVMRDLIPDALKAYQDKALTRKMAIRLARLDAEQQADALRAMNASWNPIDSDPKLADWIERALPDTTHILFSLDDYIARGGVIDRTMHEDDPPLLMSRGLALQLQTEALIATLKAESEKLGYGREPLILQSIDHNDWHDDWEKKCPKDICQIVATIDTWRLYTRVEKRMVHKEAHRSWIKDQRSENAPAGLTRNPLGPKHLRKGAIERTRILRSLIATNPRMAMALVIANTRGGASKLLRMAPLHISGDLSEVDKDEAMPRPPNLSEAGFEKNMPQRDLVARLAALDLKTLSLLFAQTIAASCYDLDYMASLGSTDQALGLVDYWSEQTGIPADTLQPDFMTASWLSNYDRGQLVALSEALDLFTPDERDAAPSWSKGELITALMDRAREKDVRFHPAETLLKPRNIATAAATKQTGVAP